MHPAVSGRRCESWSMDERNVRSPSIGSKGSNAKAGGRPRVKWQMQGIEGSGAEPRYSSDRLIKCYVSDSEYLLCTYSCLSLCGYRARSLKEDQ
ncbi:hypothetical protein EMPG_16821 [Blastomyces silverae]|uniref:Uncharacterized protein n=1 Tax=Blastomyces silverae TaxID=2060906 RepID=A0A0H1B8H5_9EURO|nr:hypothetical protein EMPG_16821 [Blastomyces silverae]